MSKSRPRRPKNRPPRRQQPSGGKSPLKGGVQQQMVQLQQQMMQTQEELAEETISASSGGGMVTVVVNGHQQVESVSIDPEVVDPEDVEMLQDMVLAAINEALEKSKALAEERMNALTGGLSIPGLT